MFVGATSAGTPQFADTDVTVADVEQDWNGGSLVVSGLLANDTVGVDTSGAFTIVAGDLLWNGSTIGTISGGVGGDLVIIFTTGIADDNTIIEALLEALQFSSSGTPVVTRTLTYTLTDAASNATSDTVTVDIQGDVNANVIKGTADGDDILGNDGADTLKGEGGNDDLSGDDGADTLVGGLGDDNLVGGADNDTLNGGAGVDGMHGGAGDDLYYVDHINDVVDEAAGEGTDTVRSSINYGLGADVENLTLIGAATSGAGNTGNNVITGGAAQNQLFGLGGDDTLNGLAGDDMLQGDTGEDVLNGGNDNDVLAGGDDNDTLNGGAGNDILNGGLGADAMAGGAGDDTYYVDDAGDTVTESGSGHDDVISYVTFTLGAGVEDLTLYGDVDGTGNTLANHIAGSSDGNTLDGGDGNDRLEGGGDDDILIGGAGIDILDGGAGFDAMSGGTGDDTYYIDSANDDVIESSGEGFDRAYTTSDFVIDAGSELEELQAVAGAGDLLLIGNELANRIIGADGSDTLYGGDGNDRLDGGTGADEMYGGSGNDLYLVDDIDDLVSENPGEGEDTVRVTLGNYHIGSSIENLYGLVNTGQRLGGNELNNLIVGADGADVLAGEDGDDDLRGGLGADILNGNAGDDIMRGGAGDDTYYVDADDIVIEADGEGTDTVRAFVDWTLEANVENLLLMGAFDLNGAGNSGDNVITGNSGWNELFGDAGDDTLNGGAGDDVLLGGDDEDTLNGGGGDDMLDGGSGDDVMNGGLGNDIYYVDSTGDLVSEAVGGSGIDAVYASTTFTLGANIEVLLLDPMGAAMDGTGNAIGNIIYGNDATNVLWGMGGADFLEGGAGTDTLHGGDGDDFLDDGYDGDVDFLYGGAGRDMLVGSEGDFLYGGIGDDLYNVSEENMTVVENDGEGYDTVEASISYTLGAFIERLDLSCAGGDIDGTGNAQANSLLGNCHVNILSGLAGNDVIEGWDGDDVLIGGLGNDRLIGGADADTFVVLNSDMVSSLLGQVRQGDVILDLDFSEGDRIDLSDIDADVTQGGDQDFYFVSAFTKQAGQARLTYNAGSDYTLLQLDVDGDGKSDYQISITGNHLGGDLLDGSEPVGVGGWLGVLAVV